MYSPDELDQIHGEWNEDCLADDDGQPDEAQEWQDFAPDC
jgi:hypothetical protein